MAIKSQNESTSECFGQMKHKVSIHVVTEEVTGDDFTCTYMADFFVQ